MRTTSRTEIWAQLKLCADDCKRVRELLITELGFDRRFVFRDFYLRVYYARRPLRGVGSVTEVAHVVLPVAATRLMVLAPGGENPRPELDPATHMIGFRIQRANPARSVIMEYRARLLVHESVRVRGRRLPSDHRWNAFGARHFQPHFALLRPGSGVGRDLRLVGVPFRERFKELAFDQFVIKVIRKESA